MRGMNNSVETVNAAATAIMTAERRVQQVTVQRRRWGGWLSMYWCFRSQRHEKRINRAALVPEVILPVPPGAPPTENPSQPPPLTLPFVVPPSSPASFLQSEPPSTLQSPAGLNSFDFLSANSYSPNGPASIFAIGPYANETQLVSPPVFSTFTTEPSTAPFTPPPESVHLTTPSSPEVPYAQLLSSSFEFNQRLGDKKFSPSHHEFQSYHLYPGSPVGNLISPSSVISGTSSPFPDLEFPSFRPNEPPKLLKLDTLALRKLISPQESCPTTSPGDGSLLESQRSSPKEDIGVQRVESVLNPRVSFELTSEQANGKRLATCAEPTSEATVVSENDHLSKETTCVDAEESSPEKDREDEDAQQQEQRQPPSGHGPVKEFIFDNADGTSAEPTVGSDWWANEKFIGAEAGPSRKNWAFFPVIQPSVS
ncbi:Uncharacterized protein QJS10_CPB18g01611 [Acorus calamus]|uniref:Hydroxyproline-rich glycoprotein family protein n=1 Tax=Acorus calamus TaxID=4465 RepID=A0AAV9CL97_ACOCL|nr:Uncharacterized protein QJS10_CPB18g01611 [Acorus calamus]